MERITDKLKKYYGGVTAVVALPTLGFTSQSLPPESIKYMILGITIIAMINLIQLLIPLWKHKDIMKKNPKSIEYYENGNPKKINY